jgi:DNA-binding PadR family transcriptional regulator
MRHGDVRAALLLALQAGPAHGYELGHRLEIASAGAWRPSPGSIYPTLQTLADQELVSSEERDGKRIYTLTKRGRAELDQRAERGEGVPWHDAYDGKSGGLREAVVALKMAAKQLGTVGTAEQCARATAILIEARRRLYELLAQG